MNRRQWRTSTPTTFESVANNYLRSGNPAQRTREEYATTIRKWSRWSGAVPLEVLGKKEIRKFLDWVHEDAATRKGSNPGRTKNKVRSHLRAVLSWAWDQDLLDALLQFSRLKPQRDVAGKHYPTKAELNSLYFAKHQLKQPRGWNEAFPVGRYWLAALAIFFNYWVDTGTVWKTLPFHEPNLWQHVLRSRQSSDREIKASSPWGWLYYHRVKTQKSFWRPMNRTVRQHLKSLCPIEPDPDSPVFHGGGTRSNSRFRELCKLPGVALKRDIESGEEQEWVLKDLRKTCATHHYDEHMPESSVEILGHSAGGITYRHYAHLAPLAFRAIRSLPPPTAFKTLAQGFEGQCRCYRRRFEQPIS